MTDDNSFEYSSEMREYYKSEGVAEEYHEAFADGGNWRHQLIASRERRVIQTLLTQIPNETVLDIPTGTGKLAPVFAETGSSVLACDISKEMLDVAQVEYRQKYSGGNIRFKVCDAEQITSEIDESFDVAVCLRLLHRVPRNTKLSILEELSQVAEYAIVSTGVESSYHKLRRNLREQIIDNSDDREHCYETNSDTLSILRNHFDIVKMKRVLPLLSQERVYLLRPHK